MNNLTGVCLIRHHINAWEQIQATIIELDKFCDKILVFSFNRNFEAQFREIQNNKIVIKYLPLSATSEAIEKYFMDCLNITQTKMVFLMEAGECFQQSLTSKIYIDTLHLAEEQLAIGLDFPIAYIQNQEYQVFDRNLPNRQIRIIKKQYLGKISLLDGIEPNLSKKESLVIPSEAKLYSYGSRPRLVVLGRKKFKEGHPSTMKSWIENRSVDFFDRGKLGLWNSFSAFNLQIEKLTGKRLFSKQKYQSLKN
jgi:hypothetical protein